MEKDVRLIWGEGYPGKLLTGSKYRTNGEERDLLKEHLKNEIKLGRVDKELIPYLNQFNKNNIITPVFSCWGHPNDGNLLFRSQYEPNQLSEVLFMPLLDKWHYGGLRSIEICVRPWYTTKGEIRQGYMILQLPLVDELKHELFRDICRLVG